jgi:hypothetical protein
MVETDLDRALAGLHETAEDVEPVRVGAQREAAAWPEVLVQHVDRALVRVVDQRPDEAEDDERHDEDRADDRQLVLREGPQHQHPRAAGDRHLAAFGDRRRLELVGIGG